jgi:biofilm PGA synthesis N-glycosyltransferase PgaC
VPALLGPGNRSMLQFWSHKLFRLFVPYALLVLLACSVLGSLQGQLHYQLLLGAQAACYAGAAAGAFLPRPGKLLGLCYTFVALNWAAVVGLGRFLTARQRVTW